MIKELRELMAKTARFKYENGITVRDKVTKFEGVITARSEHLYGCNRYFVNPPAVDGKMLDGYWFDEDSLVPQEVARIVGDAGNPRKPGGPHSPTK